MRRILHNYDTAARPVLNASHTVTVNFGFTLTQLSDMVQPHGVPIASGCEALKLEDTNQGQIQVHMGCSYSLAGRSYVPLSIGEEVQCNVPDTLDLLLLTNTRVICLELEGQQPEVPVPAR